MWSGAGSNRRPSAFQVNRAKRCAGLGKRISLTRGTALGGRCEIHANRIRCTRGCLTWETSSIPSGEALAAEVDLAEKPVRERIEACPDGSAPRSRTCPHAGSQRRHRRTESGRPRRQWAAPATLASPAGPNELSRLGRNRYHFASLRRLRSNGGRPLADSCRHLQPEPAARLTDALSAGGAPNSRDSPSGEAAGTCEPNGLPGPCRRRRRQRARVHHPDTPSHWMRSQLV
jgi:hypothetical protein